MFLLGNVKCRKKGLCFVDIPPGGGYEKPTEDFMRIVCFICGSSASVPLKVTFHGRNDCNGFSLVSGREQLSFASPCVVPCVEHSMRLC